MLCLLTASQARQQIAEGRITSRELAEACLARIDETEEHVEAWQHLDREGALRRADELDDRRRRGLAVGPLHGVPVGVKDIVDVAGMPTGCGTPARDGVVPDTHSALTECLLEAGAIVLGKTVTTEFAFLHPARTSNPRDATRTPGGSSSGSAAAVAAGHVPLAIGSQTNGSTIRPASFCGIFGFKPTRGRISRRGMLQTSVTLDQPGVFARSLDDAALLADVLCRYDPADPASVAYPQPNCAAGLARQPVVKPSLAWIELPHHDRLSDDSRSALEACLDELGGGHVERVRAPQSMSDLIEHHRVIHEYEIARHLEDDFRQHWDKISDTLKPVVERGRSYSDERYAQALAMAGGAEDYFDAFFADYDAILAPAAAGEAPLKSDGTGDPVFCTVWTLAGLPSLCMPLLAGSNGLPVGLQVIGSREHDDRLMSTARWLLEELGAAGKDT